MVGSLGLRSLRNRTQSMCCQQCRQTVTLRSLHHTGTLVVFAAIQPQQEVSPTWLAASTISQTVCPRLQRPQKSIWTLLAVCPCFVL